MKKVCVLLLAAALLVGMSVSALATEEPLSLSSETAGPGGTVYVAVTLNRPLEADSMGISFTYDKAVLAPLPNASFWEQEGLLQDFNGSGEGVWTVEKTTELSGQLCVAAFRVLEDTEAAQTELKCRLVVKNGSVEVGTFDAIARVEIACEHVFGYWHSNGEIGHYHSCVYCGARETSSHVWSEGTAGVGENRNTIHFVCQVCKAMRVVEQQTGKQEVRPSETEPKDDGHGHEHEYEPPYRDFNDPTAAHDHGHEGYVYDEHGNLVYDEHGHPVTVPVEEHAHDHGGGENGWVILLCVVLPVAALAAGGYIFLKRKK